MRNLTAAERTFGIASASLLAVFALVCTLPFLYVVSVSLTPIEEVLQRGIVLLPLHPTLAAYRELLAGTVVVSAYKITLFITLVGTALNMLFTTLTAYPLARRTLPLRSAFLLYIIFTIVFSGGMIPHYLLVKSLGLVNTVWALIVPGLVSAFYLIVMKGFIEQLPEELFESVRLDGAGEWFILVRFVVPLSLPVIVSLSLFFAVGHWNSFFDAILYLNDSTKFPLQVVLRGILLGRTNVSAEASAEDAQAVSPLSVQMAAVMATVLPVLVVYPFLQKHFAKGMLLGSVKG
ncbi:carbohydrate ABC transporter permease [Paenibacillus cymbidii]|uniref:carbohydrate ABC transporter permease n=1 Tax=Paenibacillus cymbidii TaxID=1639034 RepID=UPI001081A4D7|nr:carbohydrate ABC transporter permease [Paenibacillus cymbidii]